MAAGEYDLVIEQGRRFRRFFRIADGANVPLDLTGYSAHLQVRRASNRPVLFDADQYLTVTDEPGEVLLDIPPAVTALMRFRLARYDLVMDPGEGGDPLMLLEGSVRVKPGVTV